MSWGITLVAGLLGALAAGAGMLAIANACVRWYRITSFEGASGYFVIGLTLAGGLVGLVLSIVAARVACTQLGPGFGVQVGGALTAVAAALALVLAGTFLGADRTPDLGGRGVVIAWEVRLPATETDAVDPRQWPDEELRLQLVSVANRKPRGSADATFERDAFRLEDGQWILPARVPLFTSKGQLCVNLTLGARRDGYWPTMRPSPLPAYSEWSRWERTNAGRNEPSDATAVMVRFRFERSTEAEPEGGDEDV